MSTARVAIPFESQSGLGTNRACGAACLSMVYRSLGKEVPQEEIWPAISKPNRFGAVSSTTHLMVQDALNRGFEAVALQARHPLQALRLCRNAGAHAILNHRTRPEASTGHYSVLVSIEEEEAVLHDPASGPSRRIPYADLLELWQPRFQNSEIAGYVLIAIGPEAAAAPACEFCHTPFPAFIQCPRCEQPFPLRPNRVLGCANNGCIARMWNFVCCPSCDSGLTFSRDAPPSPAEPATDPNLPRASEEAPLNVDAIFTEVDKFSAHVLSIPTAAGHPDIKKCLEFLLQSKEELRLVLAEALIHQKVHKEKLSSLERSVQQRQELHNKRMEEVNAQAPALDGNALGRDLLKNLGFTN